MPSWEIFDHQTQEYQDSVLPPHVKPRVAVEQASSFGWERYVGTAGRLNCMKTFGASAPLKELQTRFGFEPDHVVSGCERTAGPGLMRKRDSNHGLQTYRAGPRTATPSVRIRLE